MLLGTYWCQMLTGVVSERISTCNWLFRHCDITFSTQGHSFKCCWGTRALKVSWAHKRSVPAVTEFWCFWPLFGSESGWNFRGECRPPVPPLLGGKAPQPPPRPRARLQKHHIRLKRHSGLNGSVGWQDKTQCILSKERNARWVVAIQPTHRPALSAQNVFLVKGII